MWLQSRLKGLNLIYQITKSIDYLWYLVFRGKQKKKTKTHPSTKFLHIFVYQTLLNQNYKKNNKNAETHNVNALA